MEFSPIAIVGRACLLPGAHSPQALWEAVAQGRDLITSVPPDRWRVPVSDILGAAPQGTQASPVDQAWSDRGGYIRGFDERFDPEGFELSSAQVRQLDPLTKWTLHTARAALRPSGRSWERITTLRLRAGRPRVPISHQTCWTARCASMATREFI